MKDEEKRFGKAQKLKCFLTSENIRETLTKVYKIKITDGRNGRRLKREGLSV